MIVLRFSPVSSGLFSFSMSKTRSANMKRWLRQSSCYCIPCVLHKQQERYTRKGRQVKHKTGIKKKVFQILVN